MAFLGNIAADLLKKYGSDMSGIAVIFPNKRAGIFFRKYLQDTAKKTFWAPDLFSFEEWVCSLSGLNIIDPVRLVFKLYRIYSLSVTVYKKNFEDFYFWGKMVLSDFDDIDRSLIDPGLLFDNLRELKKIEDINIDSQSPLYKKYLGFWNELESIYGRFKKELAGENSAYPGMVYREIAESSPDSGAGRWKGFVFAGFNALTAAEKKIIKNLRETVPVDIYLDMDKYFTDDESQEAGHFYRESWKSFPGSDDVKWISDELSGKKRITITGTSSDIGQAKLLGILCKDRNISSEKTAVVLADENILFPVLNSLPEEVSKINITMGYPLKNSLAYSLIRNIFDLQETMEEAGDEVNLNFKEIFKFLEHPYIKTVMDSGGIISNALRKNQTKIQASLLPFPDYLRKIAGKKWQSAGLFLKSLPGMLEEMAVLKNDSGNLETEFIYGIYILLNNLSDTVREYEPNLGLKAAGKLFDDIAANSIIPFIGEPLEGLQIMGMLETQALDFDNVFILSANEGILPEGKSYRSFIPQHLRMILGIPSRRERESIFSYHFYRLLMRAKNIHLIYTSESSDFSGTERSRFLEQILLEYSGKNKNAEILERSFRFSVKTASIKEIAVRKNADAIKFLNGMSYSATALISYMSCPLKFYFHYILRLEEENKILESPDEAAFGTIIHETLKNIFMDKQEKLITAGDYEEIRKNLKSEVKKQFGMCLNISNADTGRNRLYFETAAGIIERFLASQNYRQPFKIVSVEKTISRFFDGSETGLMPGIKIKGKIDRIETEKGITSIMDYKTGEIGSLNINNAADVFDNIKQKKEAFQLLFYLLLYCGDDTPAKSGIYDLKKNDTCFLTIDKSDEIGGKHINSFKKRLFELIHDIQNIDKPFTVNPDENTCRNCNFAELCGN